MATYSVLSGRVKRSPRPCGDRHSGSRKEMKVVRRLWLTAVSVVMASAGSDGEVRAARNSLFV